MIIKATVKNESTYKLCFSKGFLSDLFRTKDLAEQYGYTVDIRGQYCFDVKTFEEYKESGLLTTTIDNMEVSYAEFKLETDDFILSVTFDYIESKDFDEIEAEKVLSKKLFAFQKFLRENHNVTLDAVESFAEKAWFPTEKKTYLI